MLSTLKGGDLVIDPFRSSEALSKSGSKAYKNFKQKNLLDLHLNFQIQRTLEECEEQIISNKGKVREIH